MGGIAAQNKKAKPVDYEKKSLLSDNNVSSGLTGSIRKRSLLENDPTYKAMQMAGNGFALTQEYKKVIGMKSDDENFDKNKHQYISCLGGQDGFGMAGATLLGGVLKEGRDLAKKNFDKNEIEKHGGRMGIWRDSVNDMESNFKGAGHGLMGRNCSSLLKKRLD